MKHFTLFFALLLLPFGIFATDCIPDCECDTDWTLEVRGAYYYVRNKTIRRAYSSHWIDYEVEAAKRIHDFVEVWGGVSWANKGGNIRQRHEGYLFKDRTRIYVLPVSLGLKAIYPILPCVDVYVGGGVCYSFLRIKNVCKDDYSYMGLSRSPFKKEIFKNGFGGIVKLGFQYAMSDSTFLDFFADYYIQRFQFSRKNDRDVFHHRIDCGGFKFGGGIGVYF